MQQEGALGHLQLNPLEHYILNFVLEDADCFVDLERDLIPDSGVTLHIFLDDMHNKCCTDWGRLGEYKSGNLWPNAYCCI